MTKFAMVRTEATLSLVRGVDKGDTSEVVLHALPEGKQRGRKQIQSLVWRHKLQIPSLISAARRFDLVSVRSHGGGVEQIVAGYMGRRERQRWRQAPRTRTRISVLQGAAGVAVLALKLFKGAAKADTDRPQVCR